jgi:hypothetical protein
MGRWTVKREEAESLYFGGKYNRDLGYHRLWVRE